MQELKILKIDHNPIAFPPRDVLELTGEGEDFRDTRLELIKRYLRNAENKGTEDAESASRFVRNPRVQRIVERGSYAKPIP